MVLIVIRCQIFGNIFVGGTFPVHSEFRLHQIQQCFQMAVFSGKLDSPLQIIGCGGQLLCPARRSRGRQIASLESCILQMMSSQYKHTEESTRQRVVLVLPRVS